MPLVYMATCVATEKSYIGYTSGSLAKRRRSHEAGVGSCTLFKRALAKYGPDAFAWRVLVELPSREQALAAEELAIWAYGTQHPGGYNLTEGGEGPSLSPEGRALIAASNSRRVWSKTSREKLSKSLSGKTLSEPHKLKLLTAASSPEVRRKAAAAQTGRNVSQATRDKIRNSLTGRKASEESKAKRSVALSGRPKSAEHRAKIALGHVGKTHTAESKQKLRSLDRAQHINILLLLSLGATQKNVAEWFSCSQPTISRLKLGLVEVLPEK